MENSKILIRNAAQIVTCHGDKARRGAEMSDLGVIEDGAVAMSDGVITHVGLVRKTTQDPIDHKSATNE